MRQAPYLRPTWSPPPGFRTEIASTPAYDTDKQTYGIEDVVLHLTLVGPNGALTLEVGTGWFLPETVLGNRWADRKSRFSQIYDSAVLDEPSGRCVIWHRFVKPERQPGRARECYLSSTGWCLGDVGYTVADNAIPILLVNGVEGVWLWLLELYRETDWTEERFG